MAFVGFTACGVGCELFASGLYRAECARDSRGGFEEQLEDTLFALRNALGDNAYPETAAKYLNEWCAPEKAWPRLLSRLTCEEAQLFDDLCLDRIKPHLRLEQERIGYDWLCTALDGL